MVGKQIHQYQFLEKLGAGGMGEIYKAQDTRLNRFVAIKVLTSSTSGDPERRRRFLQEAQAASALNHPNIITIHDIITEADAQYMVMEYVQGKTLVDLIPKGGLRVPQVLKYALQMADALQAAHSAGIIHRDLKPGNVMATESGLVKILDFGLAKLSDRGPVSQIGDNTQTIAEAPLTVEGTIIGTVSYMSPEQAQGKKVDARSDIFSFGLVLYEMSTGVRAFSGDNALSTLSAILRDEARPIVEIAPDVPPQLEQVISRCLRKSPDDRFQSMRDVQQAFSSLKYESDSGMLYRSRLNVPAAPGPSPSMLGIPTQQQPPANMPVSMQGPAPPQSFMGGGPPAGGPGAQQPYSGMQPGMQPPSGPMPPGPISGQGMPPAMGMPPSGTQGPGMPPQGMQPVPGMQRPGMPPQNQQPQKKGGGGLIIGVLGALVVAGAAGGGGWWWYSHRTAPQPEPQPQVTESLPPPTEQPAAEPPPPAAPAEQVMNNESIIAMVAAKVPLTLILTQIRAAEKTDFDLSSTAIIALTKAGVSENIIEVMRNPKKAPLPSATPVIAGKQPPPAQGKDQKQPPQQAKGTAPAQQPSQPVAAVTPAPAPTPAPPPTPTPAPTPVIATTRVVVNDGMPFSVTLTDDIPANADEGLPVHFVVTRDFKVGETTVIAKGAMVTGTIAEGAKRKMFVASSKMTMRLDVADGVGGTKVKVRGLPGKRSDNQYARPVDTGKSKPKDMAAGKGTEYIAYVDGDQNLTVPK